MQLRMVAYGAVYSWRVLATSIPMMVLSAKVPFGLQLIISVSLNIVNMLCLSVA